MPSYRSTTSIAAVGRRSSRIISCRAVRRGYREGRAETWPLLSIWAALNESTRIREATADAPCTFVTIRCVVRTHVVILVRIALIAWAGYNVQLGPGATVDVFKILTWLARIVVRFRERLICGRWGGGRPTRVVTHGGAVIRHEINVLAWNLEHGRFGVEGAFKN